MTTIAEVPIRKRCLRGQHVVRRHRRIDWVGLGLAVMTCVLATCALAGVVLAFLR